MSDFKDLALGREQSSYKYGYGSTVNNMTPEERIKTLEHKLKYMTEAFLVVKNQLRKPNTNHNINNTVCNKDGIPINSYFFGASRGIPYILHVSTTGDYYIRGELQTSLSAAAEKVSGVRRSGWTFWKLADGKTIKEAYQKR